MARSRKPCRLVALVARPLVAAVLLAFAAAPARAATIHVPADQPTIAAGISAASWGDTVLVAPGTYYEHDLVISDFLSLLAEAGDPRLTVIDAQQEGRIITCWYGRRISGFTLTGGEAQALEGSIFIQENLSLDNCIVWGNSGFAVRLNGGTAAWITDTTIANNDDGGISSGEGSYLYLQTTIVAFNGPYGVIGLGIPEFAASIEMDHCCIFGHNTDVNCQDCPPPDYFGNLNKDPLFCDAGGGDWSLAANSPCLPENNPAGVLIGALGQGCGHQAISLRVPEEYPSIATALAAAGATDTVLVAAGRYEEHDLVLPAGVVLRGETGDPRDAVIDAAGQGRCLVCENADATTRVEALTLTGGASATFGGGALCLHASPGFDHCLFHDNQAAGGGALGLVAGAPAIEGCTFVNNSAVAGAAIHCEDASPLIHASILAHATAGEAVACAGTCYPALSCCNVFGNAGGDWTGCIAAFQATAGNLHADPRFCGATAGDYSLSASSPCLPGNNGCGVLIGAVGCGCGGVPVIHVPGGVPTIAGAIAAADSGTTVLVACGVYHEHDIPMKTGVTLRGETGDAADVIVVAQGGDHALVCDSIIAARVVGLTFTGAEGAAVLCRDATVAFTSCRTTANQGNGFQCVELPLPGSECVLSFEKCRCNDNSGDGIHCECCTSLSLAECTCSDNDGSSLYTLFCPVTVRDCRFDSNSGSGWCAIETDGTVDRCTFCGNGSSGISADYFDADLSRCTIAGNGGAGIGGNSLHGTMKHCLLANNGGWAISIDESWDELDIESCTFAANREGIHYSSMTYGIVLTIRRSIIAFSSEGPAISGSGGGHPDDPWASVLCSDTYGNAGGEWTASWPGGSNINEDPLFCDPDEGDWTLSAGSPCLPSENGCIVTMGAFEQGCDPTEAPPSAASPRLHLAANYPNPFNPSTRIRFTLPEAQRVTLRLYDVAGRLVRTLAGGEVLPAGWHQRTWDGRDERGRAMASGIYFCCLEAGASARTIKMTLLK